jgi:hypothetical protein
MLSFLFLPSISIARYFKVKLPFIPKVLFIGSVRINHLINILAIILTCETRQYIKYFNYNRVNCERVRVQTPNFYSDTMLNHHLSKKIKLIKTNRLNHLINTLTHRLTCISSSDNQFTSDHRSYRGDFPTAWQNLNSLNTI